MGDPLESITKNMVKSGEVFAPSMELPCEVFVNRILPTARTEVSKILVYDYGMTQRMVARLYGVTPSAVSQYIRGVRGFTGFDVPDDLSQECADAYRRVAEMIAGGMPVDQAFCIFCGFCRTNGVIASIMDPHVPEGEIQCIFGDRPRGRGLSSLNAEFRQYPVLSGIKCGLQTK